VLSRLAKKRNYLTISLKQLLAQVKRSEERALIKSTIPRRREYLILSVRDEKKQKVKRLKRTKKMKWKDKVYKRNADA
jgi:hypothetical protein